MCSSDLAKANPGKLTYASAGIATGGHFAAEMFNVLASVKLTHVPYKGVAPGIVDTIGGQVSLMFGVPEVVPHVKTGRLTLLAVTGSARSPAMPAVPTVAESGLPGFEGLTWFGLMVPAGTPLEIQHKLAKALQGALQHSDVQTKLMALGAEPAHGSPKDMQAVMRDDAQRWGKVIQDAGVKFE